MLNKISLFFLKFKGYYIVTKIQFFIFPFLFSSSMNRRRQPAVFAICGESPLTMRARLIYIRYCPPARYRFPSDLCGFAICGESPLTMRARLIYIRYCPPARYRFPSDLCGFAILRRVAADNANPAGLYSKLPTFFAGKFLRSTKIFYNLIFS